ncbi:MAG: hypothetical protein F4W96_08070 [Chloroflexi bacterium]|nr:hypothetical protein [Chloroflexota bacterium]
MPFAVQWTDPAKLETLQQRGTVQYLLVRQLVGSFEHDRWARGRIIADPTATGVDLRELENGPIRLRYELPMDDESVRITSVRVA